MVVAEQKKEEKDTQNTRKKKKQRTKTKTDKKNAEIFYTFLVSNQQFNSYIRKNRVPFMTFAVVVVVVAVIVV